MNLDAWDAVAGSQPESKDRFGIFWRTKKVEEKN